jgi:peptidoglycan/LPS O-acetylase OafA/YrhL
METTGEPSVEQGSEERAAAKAALPAPHGGAGNSRRKDRQGDISTSLQPRSNPEHSRRLKPGLNPLLTEPLPILHATQPAGPRFVFIDGLRGIAACCVMLFHFVASGSFGPLFQQHLPTLFAVASFGYLGVDIFFVLSGFVIAFSIRNEQITARFLRNFILRRSLRLDPPYLTTVAFTLLLLWFYNSGLHQHFTPMPTFRETLANVFYLTGILKIKPMLPVFWTLCLEVQFYLLFVLALGAGQLAGNNTTVGDGKNTIAKTRRREERRKGIQEPNFRSGVLFFFASCFAPSRLRGRIGVFLPRKRAAQKSINTKQLNWLSLSLLAALGIASIAVTGCWLPRFDGWFINDWNLFLLGSLLWWTIDRKIPPWCLIAYAGLLTAASIRSHSYAGFTGLLTITAIAITAWTGSLTTTLGNRPLQFLGKISYSLYLLHPLIGPQFDGYITWHHRDSLTASILCVCFSISVSIAAAWLMHRYIEQPGIRLGKRFHYSRDSRILSSTGGPLAA